MNLKRILMVIITIIGTAGLFVIYGIFGIFFFMGGFSRMFKTKEYF